MMKATPKFDKKIGKWIIDIETEKGEIIPVGKTIVEEPTIWRISTWDSKEAAENWIKARTCIINSSY